MAAFDFPSSPSVNQTYTANGVTWKWNGTMWMRVSGAGYLEKIEEGNSKVEVDDSGSGFITATTDGTERLRITSAGKIGINETSPDSLLHLTNNAGAGIRAGLRLESSGTNNSANDTMGEILFAHNDSNDAGVSASIVCKAEDAAGNTYLQFNNGKPSASPEKLRITSAGRIGINQTSPDAMLQVDYDEGSSEVGLRLRAYNASGSKTWQLSEINGNAGVFSIRNVTNSTAGLDIHGDGHVRVPTGDLRVGDNTDSNAGSQTISVGSVSSGSGGIGIFANPTNGNSFVQFGDGTSSADQYRGYMNYRHADDSLRFGTAGTDRLHIYANGKIHLGNGYIASNNLTRLHVGWNTGGTVAGESIIAGTLGNDTTAVSALLTMKNAGNRGAQGASGGSSLAKFEFNNGTAFEIDKYGRRTLPYQPGCKLSIDTNSTGGGNHAQTGRTILPFNNTAFGYNTGNHFNTSNHTFTAPLDGKYLVILSVNVIGDNIAYIYKNGSIHSAGEFRSNPNGVWEHMEISTVVDCSANDTIQPYSQLMNSSGRKFNGGNQPGSYWDTFTIYFLG